MAKYFEVQRQWPELYGNFKFDTVKELLLAGVSEMMPKRDDDGVMYTVFRKNYEKMFARKNSCFIGVILLTNTDLKNGIQTNTTFIKSIERQFFLMNLPC